MIFTILLALTGLTLSTVAIYYSVLGLTAIFAAAYWPVVVMGTTLEVSKLVAASWLKAYWSQIPRLMKIYMMSAVAVLMLITSMGIFGYLSSAHSSQNALSEGVIEKLSVIDEKIAIEKTNIEEARKSLLQLDSQVNARLDRSTDDKGAERAVQIRRQQQSERSRLQKDISTSQSAINALNLERAPISSQVRKIEAEVGPIKYIAKFVYGDSANANLLEKSVTWVIIIIVAVFDPLAIVLLLASQITYKWRTQQKTLPESVTLDQPIIQQPEIVEETPIINTTPVPEVEAAEPAHTDESAHSTPWPTEWTTAPELIQQETSEDTLEDVDIDALDIDTDDKEAMRIWKNSNPGMTIKKAVKLFEQGILSELPWASKKKRNT